MEVVRYADRPDLRERRRDELNEFPEYMNHNAMGWKYWGRLYDDFPARARSCPPAGTRRSSAAWKRAVGTSSRCSR
jgi:hypothetical protein